MAKVSDVLKLSVMRGVRVVAGEEGLFRKVEHVTVMEVPEIKRWLKGIRCGRVRRISVP